MLSSQEIDHLANLARLGLSQEEKAILQKELASILDYVNKLQAVATKKTEPTAQVTGLVNVMREDEVKPFDGQEDILEQAPEREGGYFKVKGVFGGE
jgi:aspartyl-tRNA(Asn)/glutamyl-tRNA(Gln) amidotransferase subunit C